MPSHIFSVIPTAGPGTPFLPITKIVSKEFFCVTNKPVIQYPFQEVIDADISEFISIVNPNNSTIELYFTFDPPIENDAF